MRIALAGNPNSGKTTMFNALTGRNEKVGNWAGVTVEKKEYKIKKSFYSGEEELVVVDLPGAYSMSPFTSEESVTSSYIQEEKLDAIINIVDATNLSRSLFFTTQLLELGVPVVVALNKADINKKKETEIDESLLSKKLGCPVLETVSTSANGLKAVIAEAVKAVGRIQLAPFTQENIDLTDKAAVQTADRKRFEFVNAIVAEVETRKVFTSQRNVQDKIDAVLTNKWFGLPIFAVVMFLVFGISQAWLGPWLSDIFCGWLEAGQDLLAAALTAENGEMGIWASMLVDGVVGGVIAVVGFLPLVMVMYFTIALLEDCGYMARASVVLDPIFKKVGLSGKSIISFIIGTGCAIPGVMACRTIRNERERKATAMLTPFMPCGAKLPVISLFAGAFFGNSAWVGVTMYFAGIAIILGGALLINALTGNKKRKSFFIIELPEYKWPSVWGACKSMFSRAWSYIVKAGTIILVCNFIIHVMQTFNWSFQAVEAEQSILHDIATPFAYFIAPIIGICAWQLAAATITGFIAKENVVGTLAVCYGITNFFNLEDMAMMEGAESTVAAAFAITKVAALAFLMLNLFSPPCFAAIGAMNAEIKDKKWFWAGIGLQVAVGYVVSFLVFFFGTLFSGAGFGEAWMPIVGWCITLAIAAVFTTLIIKKRKQTNA